MTNGSTPRPSELKPYADAVDLAGDSPTEDPAPAPAAPPYDPAQIQSHILTSNEPVTHACVVLLRVTEAEQARSSLSALASAVRPAAATGGVAYLIGFTHAGLARAGDGEDAPRRLSAGIHRRHGGAQFAAGRRARQPPRPLAPAAGLGPGGQRAPRRHEGRARARPPAAEGPGEQRRPPCIRVLATEVAALDAKDGLRVLAVQPTFAVRNAKGEMAGHLELCRRHQPTEDRPHRAPPADPPLPFDERVWPGEVLLGHANNREDAANLRDRPAAGSTAPSWWCASCASTWTRWTAAMTSRTPAERDELLSRMMGRQRDGTPLVPLPPGAGPNDFNYDKASDACPYHSHVRRANPRDGRRYTPRIIRRGMSYGPPVAAEPAAERGLVFMAYCASLAEQYETIQRWITGGNSSGVGSAQGDAFLRVPQIGREVHLPLPRQARQRGPLRARRQAVGAPGMGPVCVRAVAACAAAAR